MKTAHIDNVTFFYHTDLSGEVVIKPDNQTEVVVSGLSIRHLLACLLRDALVEKVEAMSDDAVLEMAIQVKP